MAVTVYPMPWQLAFKLHVQVRTLNGRNAEYFVVVDQYAVEDLGCHEYIIQEAVREVVYFVIQSNPRSFM
jgi:hypothetical protein